MDSVVTGVEFANSISDLINRKAPNNAQLARVVSANPIKIQLQTGLILNRSDILISRQLLQYSTFATFTTKNPSITANSSASTSVSVNISNSVTSSLTDENYHSHTVTSSPTATANTSVSTSVNQQSQTPQSTEMKFQQLLKTGDTVLVTVIGDNYIVTDIVE